MNSRQRFALAMRHQAADRVPLDIGGTSLTGMRPGCQARLRELLGFTGQPAATWRGIDERLLEWIGSDFRSVGAIVSLPSPHTQALSPTARVDCWGIRRDLVGGDWQITHHPLRDATVDDLAAFPWPEPRIDEERARHLGGAGEATESRRALRRRRRAPCLRHPGAWLLDVRLRRLPDAAGGGSRFRPPLLRSRLRHPDGRHRALLLPSWDRTST